MPKIPFSDLRGLIPMQDTCVDVNGFKPVNTEHYLITIRYRFCPLFGVETTSELAEVLGINESRLLHYAWRSWRYYTTFPLTTGRQRRNSSSRPRIIEAPHEKLKAIQKRFKVALAAIPTPAYLASPVENQSTADNAQQHCNRRGMAKVDIQNFYSSCKQSNVFRFFLEGMEMSEKVARVCTHLVCYGGHVPTGAPTSPLIAFYANESMFYDIHQNVWHDGCRMSLWIDDINTSELGAQIITPAWLEAQVVDLLRRYGFMANQRKTRIYHAQEPALVTGIVVMPDGELRMQNRLHKKMYDAKCLSRCQNLSASERERQRQIAVSLKHHLKHIRKKSRISKYIRAKTVEGTNLVIQALIKDSTTDVLD
jgi:RNA-directed DNA polymerase